MGIVCVNINQCHGYLSEGRQLEEDHIYQFARHNIAKMNLKAIVYNLDETVPIGIFYLLLLKYICNLFVG